MPPANTDFQRQLDRLTDLPSGDADDWRDRYAPIIDEVVDHGRPDDPLVSVIVVGWQTGEDMEETLSALSNQQGLEESEYELVVVDNGLEPLARAAVERHADLDIRMRGNANQCRARNVGAAWAYGPLLAFVDDDGVVKGDFLKAGMRYFQDDDTLIGIRGKIICRERPLLTAFALHYDRGPNPINDCMITEGCALIRRQTYLAAGGYAESVVGHEGLDLSFRLQKANPEAKMLYAPDVVMKHDYFDGLWDLVSKSLRYAHIDEHVIQERPRIEPFLESYFARDFPVPRESVHQKCAYYILMAGRALQQTVRLISPS